MRAAWWWIDRWRKSTAYTDMTAEQQGVYRNLLDELWLRDGCIPNDERILAKIGGDPEAWPRVRAVVLARFIKTPEGLRHETHDEVSSWPNAQAEKGRKRAANAPRAGGRFTSPAPASPPAEHQPEPPAHDQPVPPAQHQPPSPSPYSVLRTPLPSPKRKRNAPSASSPDGSERKGHDTWLTPYGVAWKERWGPESEPPYGEMSKAFVDSHARLGPEELCSRWTRFLTCAQTSQWARPTRFVQGLGEWAEKSLALAIPKPTPKEQKHRDVLRASMLGGLKGDGTLGGADD